MQTQQWTTPGTETLKNSWIQFRPDQTWSSTTLTWHTEDDTTVELRTNTALRTHQCCWTSSRLISVFHLLTINTCSCFHQNLDPILKLTLFIYKTHLFSLVFGSLFILSASLTFTVKYVWIAWFIFPKQLHANLLHDCITVRCDQIHHWFFGRILPSYLTNENRSKAFPLHWFGGGGGGGDNAFGCLGAAFRPRFMYFNCK